MFRWKGIIFLIVFAGLIFIASLFLTDAWLENQIEEVATGLNGAKVEIDNLDFSLWGPKLSWKRLQVTDPNRTMKNMVESGNCEFNLEFWPLLSKKVIIENILLDSLRTNTDRETDGKIDHDTYVEQVSESNFVKETVGRLQKKVESTPVLQLAGQVKSANIDSIMSILQITSVKKIDSLHKQLETQYNRWNQELTSLNYDNDLKKIEGDVKSLDVKKIKGIEDFRSALNKVDQIKSSIDKVSKDVQNKKLGVQKDLTSATNNLTQVDNWVSEDYSRALSMAKLPEINTGNISEMIFGKEVVDQVGTYLGYVGEARSYAEKFKSDKPEKQDPPRLKGQDIYFYSEHARPDFWIQKVDLSGTTENGINLTGTVADIVSDQRQIGKTTQIGIKGSHAEGASLDLAGELDYLTEVPAEKFKLQYAGFSLANTSLSESELLPNKVKNGNGTIEADINISGDFIDGKIKFTGSRLTFDFSEQKKKLNKLEEMLYSVFQSITMVDLYVKIKGEKDNLNFNLNSNLDELLASKMKAQLGKEVDAAKQKVKARIDKEVNKYRGKLNAMVSDKETMIKNEIAKYEKMVNEKVALADKKKKEIEKEIDKQKNKQLDKVKDILKF